jgi:hypothetical protein
MNKFKIQKLYDIEESSNNKYKKKLKKDLLKAKPIFENYCSSVILLFITLQILTQSRIGLVDVAAALVSLKRQVACKHMQWIFFALSGGPKTPLS